MEVEEETRLLQFDELSPESQDRARMWWRSDGLDYEWWDSIFEDFREVAEILGVSASDQRFSGFWSQGDGASYSGSYQYSRQAPRRIAEHAPLDEELLRIARKLQDVQRRSFYALTAAISYRSSSYCHEQTMWADVESGDKEVPSEIEGELSELLRDLARWLYRQLEKEYEFLVSDEHVEEAIRMNEYTFDETGRRT